MSEEEKILREQSWNYFALVADQRLRVINFYFLISTGLSAGLIALLNEWKDFNPTAAGILGILLVSLSLIFCLWDKRNKIFVDCAGDVLTNYANKNINLPFPLKEIEKKLKNDTPKFFKTSVYPNFTNCLRYLYILFGFVGLMGVSLSILYGWKKIISIHFSLGIISTVFIVGIFVLFGFIFIKRIVEIYKKT